MSSGKFLPLFFKKSNTPLTGAMPFDIILIMAKSNNGFTQASIAREAGVNQSVVSRMARGERGCTWATAKRLAAVLACTPAELMDNPSRVIQEALNQ